jgi:hypothetical protein
MVDIPRARREPRYFFDMILLESHDRRTACSAGAALFLDMVLLVVVLL